MNRSISSFFFEDLASLPKQRIGRSTTLPTFADHGARTVLHFDLVLPAPMLEALARWYWLSPASAGLDPFIRHRQTRTAQTGLGALDEFAQWIFQTIFE